MLSIDKRNHIQQLMRQEIVPSVGCTEPIAVALCAAKACSVLGRKAEKIEAYLSGNVLKNALGVGIPGTGMTGLPIAIALGALTGKPEEELELLKNVTHEQVEQGKRFIEEERIGIHQQTGITDKLYINIRCSAAGESAVATIAGHHNYFTYIEKNGKVLLDKPVSGNPEEDAENNLTLNFRTVYEYAVESPLEELSFILEAARMNRNASRQAMLHSYGHNVAGSLKNQNGLHVFGDNLHTRMIISTAGACDMRMDGGLVPVMTNSGSGNQGIAATMPVLTYAESESCSDEQLIRALTMSSLLIIYIKQQLGKLSALCGCVVASTGSSCGITYLMGGSYEQIVYAAKNMIANITGMICDGAKPGCALKIASGVSTAALSAVMAMEDEVVTSKEGIVDEDIDRTIENLARIGNSGMQETDKLVLDIMTKK
ncbi:serine dehydratase subunit alpha family protein [Proteiniphilum sp. UBA5384]|uniref:L-cysteine desulfidase family protein n=1 Tax=Proteiniphilum sp. UBA5384 TaxID=1947279 RepID=UPI0025E63471|nr:L-serine ammonia-lyase, iron-sulfur-dependent, subunit alpha [Proteiniphilum sp. UBA5384]